MTPGIEIDDEVMEELKRHAEPFVDTPNDVLRRLVLNTEAGDRADVDPRGVAIARGKSLTALSRQSRAEPAKRKRTASDALLAEKAYEIPILRVLEEAGGRLPTREAVAAVGELVVADLMPLDREVMENGRERWEMRVQFSRLRLVERDLLKKKSPRGVWEISDAGRIHLKSQAVTA